MRIAQKLEVFFGFATFFAGLLSFYLIVLSGLKKLEDLGYARSGILLRAFLFLLLPALLVAIGAYINAAKQSKIGLGLVVLCGGAISFLHLISFLTGDAFEGRLLVGVLPGVFAFVTILLAIVNSILPSATSNSLS